MDYCIPIRNGNNGYLVYLCMVLEWVISDSARFFNFISTFTVLLVHGT